MMGRTPRIVLVAALALAAFGARADDWIGQIQATAAPYEEIVHVAVRQGVDEPMLLSMASKDQKPKRIVMLFPGGDGIMQIQQKARGKWFHLWGNYLIRTRAQFVDGKQCEHPVRWTDETQTLGGAAAREVGTFREEPVAWMHAVAMFLLCNGDERIDVEIGGDRIGSRQFAGGGGDTRMETKGVRLRINAHRLHLQVR